MFNQDPQGIQFASPTIGGQTPGIIGVPPPSASPGDKKKRGGLNRGNLAGAIGELGQLFGQQQQQAPQLQNFAMPEDPRQQMQMPQLGAYKPQMYR